MTSPGASRLSVMTMRVSLPEDSSLASEMPSISLVATNSLILDSTALGPTWYGSWLITILSPPREDSSISATARIRMVPRPVR